MTTTAKKSAWALLTASSGKISENVRTFLLQMTTESKLIRALWLLHGSNALRTASRSYARDDLCHGEGSLPVAASTENESMQQQPVGLKTCTAPVRANSVFFRSKDSEPSPKK